MRSSCTTEQHLRDFLSGRLPGDVARSVSEHLSQCADCAARCDRLSRDSIARRAFQLQRSDTPETDDSVETLRQRIYRQCPGNMVAEDGPPSRTAPLAPGTRIAQFELMELLGSGGFARVYLARDCHLDRRVAIKIPHGSAHLNPDLRNQLRNEGRIAAKLRHPSIVPVHEVGESDGHLYIAADYCPGPTLATWRQTLNEPVPVSQAARIVMRLADAVEHAHLNGLIHRDVKPANVLLDPQQPDGELPFSPRLTDFGLAKWMDSNVTQTTSQMLKGTPCYMAPEQAQGLSDEIGPASDVYSLGVILYELLTGQRPIEGATQVDTLRRLVTDTPVPPRRTVPTIPRDLDAITMKCLEKSAPDRYPSARALAEDLHRFLNGNPTMARPLNPVQRFSRWSRRNPAIAGATVTTLLVLCIAALVLGLNNRRLNGLNHQLQDVTRQQSELLYAADMQLASRAIMDGDLRQAHQLLDAYVPAGNEPDLRGFEWSLLRHTHNAIETTLDDHMGDVYMVRFSPDGRYLASAGKDGAVRIYGGSEFHRLSTFPVGAGEINGIAFSPESQRIAAAADDGCVYVFDIQTQRQILRFEAHDGLAFQVLFTPDGESIFTCGNDVHLRKWDANTGSPLGTLGTPTAEIQGIAISADGRFVASASNAGGFVWETETERLVHQLPIPLHVNSVSISPDGWISWATRHAQCILEQLSDDGQILAAPPQSGLNDPVEAVAFSPDSHWHAAGDRGGVIRISPVGPHSAPELLSDNADAYGADNSISWQAHTGRVWSLDFSPDGGRIATAGADGAVRIWHVDRDHLTDSGVQSLFDQSGFVDFAVSEDGVVATTTLHNLSLWDMTGDSPVRSEIERDAGREFGRLAIVAANASHGLLVISGNQTGEIRAWDMWTRRAVSTWNDEQQRDVLQLQAAPDGTLLFVLLSGDLLCLEIPELQPVPGWSGIRANRLAISSSGRWMAVGKKGDDNIDIWDLTLLRRVRTLPGHTRSVTGLDFSPDEQWLASGSDDRSVKVWNVQTGELVREILGHRAPISHIAFSPTGLRLVSTAQNGMTDVSMLPGGRHLMSLGSRTEMHHPTNKVLASPEGRFLVRLSGDLIEVYDLRDGERVDPRQ